MKLKFTRKTWYFFLLAAAAVSMLGGFAVLGGMDFSALELVAFCLTGIAALFLAAQKGAPAAEKRNYTLVFVLLMLSKLAAGGWAISTLVASVATLKVYFLSAIPAMEFSVMTGFRIISCAVFISQAPPRASSLRRR